MHHGLVSDGAIVAHRERVPGIDVEHAVVLNIAAFTDLDQFVVGPQHGAEPDAGVAFQADLPDQHSCWGNPAPRSITALWGDTIQGIDWHSTCSSSETPCI